MRESFQRRRLNSGILHSWICLALAIGLGIPGLVYAEEASIVKWREWNAQTFAEARRLERPICLWIGAKWSHTALRMDREVWGEVKTASWMNELFIPVRVDRDRRPDVDVRYQEAVLALGEPEGWPLTVFLTPEGEVINGGAWHSREDDYVRERPGVSGLLRQVAEAWRERRDETRTKARELDARLRQASLPSGSAGAASTEVLKKNAGALLAALAAQGADADGPAFPNPQALEFALVQYARSGDAQILRSVQQTLDAMLRGGIQDQIEGGFHRFAVDHGWKVPRFEKLLSVNAEMCLLCLHAWQATGSSAYAQAAERTLRWADRELRDHEHGGYFASQAADAAPGDDGGYYTWTVKEMEAAIEDEKTLKLACLFYGVEEWGEMAETAPHRNVLFQALPLEQAAQRAGIGSAEAPARLEQAVALLKSARAARRAPPIDRCLLVDANARIVSALLLAAACLEATPAEIQARRSFAIKTLDRLLRQAVEAGRGVAHVLEPGGAEQFSCLCSDEAALVLACQDAYAATGEARYLDAARDGLKRLRERFRDEKSGVYLDRGTKIDGGPEALGRLSDLQAPYQDLPMPSANAMATLANLRMHALTGEGAYREQAAGTLDAFAGLLEQIGLQGSALNLATDALLQGITQVVVEGNPGDQKAQELLRTAWRSWAPHLLVLASDAANRGLAPCALVKAGKNPPASATRADKLRELIQAAGKR